MPRVAGLGRVWDRLTSGIIGIGVGTAIGPAIEPAVEELKQEAWLRFPVRALDPHDLAQVAVKFPGRRNHYRDQAERSGINEDRFNDLVEIANQAPGASDLLDLWRRGLIDRDAVAAGLRDALMNQPYVDAVMATKESLLSPAELAAARQQGFVDEARQKRESEQSGLDAERSQILFELAGLPPGVMDGLTMLRRGIINEATYRRIVAEGNTKVKYTDALLALKEDILLPSEIVNAVVQNHLGYEEGAAMAAKHGITRADFDIMYRTRGNPIGTIQGIQLLRRGVIDEKTFAQIVAESATKTKYTDALLALRRAVPSAIQIRAMVSTNAISDEQAIGYMHDLGYDDTTAKGVVMAAHAGKSAKHRDISESIILDMYEVRELSREDALNFLQQLGYSEQESNFVLDTIEARRRLKFLRAIIETIHKRFVSGSIDETTARGLLANQVPNQASTDEYLALWNHERDANVHRLGVADIKAALRGDAIVPGEAYSRLIDLGYPPEDAAILVTTWWGSDDWSNLGPTPPVG